MHDQKRLRRSRRHKIIAGVCGGIAEYFGWSPLIVRVLYVILSLFPLLPGILVYILLWIVIPKEEGTSNYHLTTVTNDASLERGNERR